MAVKKFGFMVNGTAGHAGKGEYTSPAPTPNGPDLLDRTEYWQALFRDDEAEYGWSSTNGLIVTIK